MATLKGLKEELKPYKNTLVISERNRVVKLVGVKDGEEDFYWIYDTPDGADYDSCVGMWIALKGVLPDKQYESLVRCWNLNNIEKAV